MQEEKPPRIFANHVLKQLVQHMLGEECVIHRDDFVAMRVVFRRCGGSWVRVESGDLSHIDLLKKIVTGWGMLPDRAAEAKEII